MSKLYIFLLDQSISKGVYKHFNDPQTHAKIEQYFDGVKIYEF